MTLFSCGMVSGPKMLNGGLSSVTRQYSGVRRSSRISCFGACVSSGAGCSRRLAGVSGIDACHCGSYECFSKDVRFHSGHLGWFT
jgi:hypothetical protein